MAASWYGETGDVFGTAVKRFFQDVVRPYRSESRDASALTWRPGARISELFL
jgi:hypothetical protein